jgi:hypothetical protein
VSLSHCQDIGDRKHHSFRNNLACEIQTARDGAYEEHVNIERSRFKGYAIDHDREIHSIIRVGVDRKG